MYLNSTFFLSRLPSLYEYAIVDIRFYGNHIVDYRNTYCMYTFD